MIIHFSYVVGYIQFFYYSLLNFNISYRDNAITTTIPATMAIAVMILGVELITSRHGTSIPCSFASSEISPGFFDNNLENFSPACWRDGSHPD